MTRDNFIAKDLKYIWHPYTQMQDCEELPPILIEKARGMKLYDVNGNFYYDTISSWWCNIHGHNHPKIKSAIKRQLDKLEHVLFAGFTHRPAIELAERLVKITPKSLTKVFFSDNGSTAVETALKMSFQYWQNIGKKDKTRFVSFENGYHGDTIGAMSVSGVGRFNELFRPLFFKSYRCTWDSMEDVLKKKAQEICAIILEPLVMAAGGMIIYPKENLEKAARLAKKYNVHLILDEVATGFGRTGKMFACQYTDVQPDFMCLSKGITAGYLPLGATLTTDKIYDAFYGSYTKTFFHGHTYTANPLSCAAANASLDIFKEENTLRRVREFAPILRKELDRFRDYPFVKDTRCIGVIGAIELVRTKERIAPLIYKEGLRNNLLLRPLGNVIYLFLPQSVTLSEFKDITKKMHTVLTNVRYMAYI